ncbi:MAG: DUF4406 domain-containing protein [Methanoregulaceae archaeon]|nr:DUF4406 domain-containing protein [Methanoregulaceae archaeon]
MRRPVLYLSGPLSHPDPHHGIELNILRASEIALKCWDRGWAVICPHKNCAGFQHYDHIPWRAWIEGDIEIMLRCDAVLMLPGWQDSDGAREEHFVAIKERIPVFYCEDEQSEIPGPRAVSMRRVQ